MLTIHFKYSSVYIQSLSFPLTLSLGNIDTILIEVKSDHEREISYDIAYMWNLKRNDTDELTYETEMDSQT